MIKQPPRPIRPGIPSRPVTKAGPPPRPQVSVNGKKLHLQINRLFDEAKEMEDYVRLNHAGSRIVKTWAVTQFACEIEIKKEAVPEKPKATAHKPTHAARPITTRPGSTPSLF